MAALTGKSVQQRGRQDNQREAKRRWASGDSAARRDIGTLPAVADPGRKARSFGSLRVFIDTYLIRMFASQKTGEHWPWSVDHLRVINKIEKAVLAGGLFGVAMPRGHGKTSLIKAGILWAILYGHCRWVCVIAATSPKAQKIIKDLQVLVETNGLLAADFPEACYPIACLERITNRQKGQTYQSAPTRITWNSDEIVLPDIPGSACAQGRVTCTGLEGGGVRGQVAVSPDGGQVRPDVVLLDDPQTRESARSEYQTHERLELLAADVLEMGPPGQPLAGLMAVTVIAERDMADQILENPDWHGVRTKMLEAYPVHRSATPADVAHADWWDQYSRLLSDGMDDQASELYASHRCKPECEDRLDEKRECLSCSQRIDCMDADAVVSWKHRKYPKDLSAIQHAMNRAIRTPAAFAAEMQQAPLSAYSTGSRVKPSQVIQRVSGLARGRVPPECTKLTAYIDVHDEILYWVVCAWQEDFTGQVIDYGTYPEQPTSWFKQSDPPRAMSRVHPGGGKDGVIAAGLESLAGVLLKHEFTRHAGGAVTAMNIDRLLVDSGYKPGIVASVRRKIATSAMQASKGKGITSAQKPISAYQRKPGWVLGDGWYVPSVRGTREFPHVMIDTNHWKTFAHNGLATNVGDPGALTLFGSAGHEADHEPFAEQVAGSQHFVETSGGGRVVNVWQDMPGHPDGHWWDALVGCFVGASMLGCKLRAQREERPEASGRRARASRGLGQLAGVS